ncbi:MFS transporter [Rhizobium sp. JAB6]|uniref:MFS transporter n=1 Tax=Rhizobium sp. JAB6 TaxID=2127050 RepID=UPI001FE14B0A|nr:MFS transporter [Rhizobium sp. JAB6]
MALHAKAFKARREIRFYVGEQEMRATLPSLCAAFIASMYFRSYFGIVGPPLSQELKLDPAEFGYLASAFFTSFSLLQIPVGLAFDRWGVRWPMCLMMTAGAGGSAMVASAMTFWWSALGQLLIGVGCAPVFMGVLYFLGVSEPPERAGRLATIVSSVGSVGALLSASPLSWFSERFGWRSACWSAALLMFLSALAIGFVLRAKAPAETASEKDGGRWKPASLLYLLPICFTLSLGGTFRNAWASPYLTGVFGTGTNVGAALTAVSIFAIATSFALPVVLTRCTGRAVVIAALAAGVACALVLSASPGNGLATACAGLAVLYAIGNIHPIVMTEAQAFLPSGLRGVGLGALNTLVFLGVSVSSSVFGAIANVGLPPESTYRLIFASTALMLGFALAIYAIFGQVTRPAPGISKASE